MKILVAYHSEEGHTEQLAHAVAEGAAEVPGAHVECKAVHTVTVEDLQTADGIILGSPVYGGTVSHQMKEFMDITMGELWASGELAGKVGGAFATCRGQHGGVETTLETILRVMLGCSMVITGPYIPREEIQATGAAYGATFVANTEHEQLGDADRHMAHSLGRRVAEVADALAGSMAGARREGALHAA